MAERLRHPDWCLRSACAVRLQDNVISGEHVGSIRLPNPAGDDPIAIRLWLVGVPMTEDGLPDLQSTFVNLEMTEEGVTTTFVIERMQAIALYLALGQLVEAVSEWPR